MREKVTQLLVGKTIEQVEFLSWKADNDTLILHFTDKTHIKIVSDPNCMFDGLSFFVNVKKSKVIEIEEDEEIK